MDIKKVNREVEKWHYKGRLYMSPYTDYKGRKSYVVANGYTCYLIPEQDFIYDPAKLCAGDPDRSNSLPEMIDKAAHDTRYGIAEVCDGTHEITYVGKKVKFHKLRDETGSVEVWLDTKSIAPFKPESVVLKISGERSPILVYEPWTDEPDRLMAYIMPLNRPAMIRGKYNDYIDAVRDVLEKLQGLDLADRYSDDEIIAAGKCKDVINRVTDPDVVAYDLVGKMITFRRYGDIQDVGSYSVARYYDRQDAVAVRADTLEVLGTWSKRDLKRVNYIKLLYMVSDDYNAVIADDGHERYVCELSRELGDDIAIVSNMVLEYKLGLRRCFYERTSDTVDELLAKVKNGVITNIRTEIF